ncbi:S-layer homology domain-containing protein [Peribacillus alkalitolerans]|uniref:S-layer homology domain-containing protein n=1 Tax=Peribacillus alkalitolerans TaxID=1550385 RepID=UPI0013D01A7C|nr:S-layer homology domain-containing protein [Peribacillus alkalitolerans]
MNFRKFLVAGALSCSLALGTVGATQAFAVEFVDTSGLSSESSINKLVSLGIMKNTGDTFNPDAGLTRSEFVLMVNSIMGLSTGSKKVTFSDLSQKHKDYNNTLRLVNNGYLSVDKGAIKPNKGVTYAELSKVLAQGLGLKKSWTNRPVDYLFYLNRKEVLDIDVDLDEVVTKEAAAVAFDKYITQKGLFTTETGIVASVHAKGFTLTDGSSYTFASNVSVLVSGQGATIDDLQVGSPATVILNKKGTVAYYGGELLDAEESTIKYGSAKWTIGTLTKEVNLDAFVQTLPNNPGKEFGIKLIDEYQKAGAQFSGQVFFTNIDEVTALYPYIAKAENKAISVNGNALTLTLSATISETFNISEEVKVTLNGKDATLADVTAKQTAGETISATIEADKFGNVTVITATSAPKK